jgi:uncharacterized protein YcbX
MTSDAHATSAGVVAELWRYPVKSMLGERRDRLTIDERGVAGDRLYAVRDDEGKLGSGKDTRRFRRMDGLFECRARYQEDVPVITLPDGREVRGDDPDVDEHLRRSLDRDHVVLAREEAVPHFDVAPLHLVTDAALTWLADAVPHVAVDARRFRPNLVIRTGRRPGPVEDGWIGRTAYVGDELVVEFSLRTERCVMVGNAQDDLEQSRDVLRTIADVNDLTLGVYARVVRGGTVRVGDALRFVD